MQIGNNAGEVLALVSCGTVWSGVSRGDQAPLPAISIALAAAAGEFSESVAMVAKRMADTPEAAEALWRVRDRMQSEFDFVPKRSLFGAPKPISEISVVLDKLAAWKWPAPHLIAKFAAQGDGFPRAVADFVVAQIGRDASATKAGFDSAEAHRFATEAITAAMTYALEERKSFAGAPPYELFKRLNIAVNIARAIFAANEPAETMGAAIAALSADLEPLEEEMTLQVKAGLELFKKGKAAEEAGAAAEAVANYSRAAPMLAESPLGLLLGDPFEKLGGIALERGDIAGAEAQFTQSFALHRRHGNRRGEARAMARVGEAEQARGNFADAKERFDAVLAMYQKLGNDQGVAEIDHNLGELAAARGDLNAAEVHYKAALAFYEKLKSKGNIALLCSDLGALEMARENFTAAAAYFERALKIAETSGKKSTIANVSFAFAVAKLNGGNVAEGRRLLQKTRGLFAEIGDAENLAKLDALLGAGR